MRKRRITTHLYKPRRRSASRHQASKNLIVRHYKNPIKKRRRQIQ